MEDIEIEDRQRWAVFCYSRQSRIIIQVSCVQATSWGGQGSIGEQPVLNVNLQRIADSAASRAITGSSEGRPFGHSGQPWWNPTAGELSVVSVGSQKGSLNLTVSCHLACL